MKRNEVRYRIISTLLQAGRPLSLPEIVEDSGTAVELAVPNLRDLVGEGLIVEGALLTDRPSPQYCWRTRWEERAQERVLGAQQGLRAAVGAVDRASLDGLDLDSEPVRAFHRYVITEYRPPRDKRFLVFLQCSVRRPFSTSPSHASMRRAIRVATGYDPRSDFESCPLHVVVLASKIGPVPYELEDVYPANVRGGGVKHLSAAEYARAKPILSERLAEYIVAHHGSYEKVTTFTEGRYGEVMEQARRISVARCGRDVSFPILPRVGGARIIRMGRSEPRQYWARYWIQLYLQIVEWLDPEQRVQAEARLRRLKVVYR
jgi:hypothetical protein